MKGLERRWIRVCYYVVVVNSIAQLAAVTFGWSPPRWCVIAYLALLFQFSLAVASHQWYLAKIDRKIQAFQDAMGIPPREWISHEDWDRAKPEPKRNLPVRLIKIRKADDDEYPS